MRVKEFLAKHPITLIGGRHGPRRWSSSSSSNYCDVLQVSHGPADPGQDPTGWRCKGVVDTGATRLVLPESVVEQLGLPVGGPARPSDSPTIGGEQREVVTDAYVQLLGPGWSVQRGGRTRAGPTPSSGAIVLEDLDLVVDCTGPTARAARPEHASHRSRNDPSPSTSPRTSPGWRRPTRAGRRPRPPPRRGPARRRPDDYTTLTFAELHADSDALAHGLTAAGVGRGTRVAVMVPPGVDFFALTFALFKVAAVPVLDRSRAWASATSAGAWPRPNRKRSSACPRPTSPAGCSAGPGRRFASTVNVGRGRFFCRHSLDGLRDAGRPRGPFRVARCRPRTRRPRSSSPAAAPGVAKGVVYTHGIFAAQVELLKATYGIEPGEVDLCTFPLFALFGPALGMTCVVPDMDPARPARIDPRKAVAQIEQFGVTNLFGSPAVVRRLGTYGTTSSAKLETVPPGDFRRSPRPGLDPRTACRAVARDHRDLHAVRRDGGAARVEHRQPRNPGRDPAPHRPGTRRVRRPAGRGHGRLRHPHPRRGDRRVGRSAMPAAGRGGRVRRPRAGRHGVLLPSPGADAAGEDSATAPTGGVLHRMGDVGYLDGPGRLWYLRAEVAPRRDAGRDVVHRDGGGRVQHRSRRAADGPCRGEAGRRDAPRSSASNAPTSRAAAVAGGRTWSARDRAATSRTRGVSRRFSNTRRSRRTCGTTPRSSGRSLPRGRKLGNRTLV